LITRLTLYLPVYPSHLFFLSFFTMKPTKYTPGKSGHPR
jgi:hypothetical protein